MRIGHVAAIWRYPVKSMKTEPLESVEVSWHGLTGDRRWAFIRDDVPRSGFPWLTIRERAQLVHYRPWFAEPDRPDRSPTMVRTPHGADLEVVDPALAAELGTGLRVLKQDRGIFDTMPLSLITTRAVDSVGALVGGKLDVLRFRPNLVIEPQDDPAVGGGVAFPEDAWVGAILRIGDLRFRVDQRDKRCVMVNVDPVTTERDPAILRAIARHNDVRLGIYGSTVQPGRVGVGDPVFLEG